MMNFDSNFDTDFNANTNSLSDAGATDSLELVCGLSDARPLAPGEVGEGMVVSIGGQLFDLGSSSAELGMDLGLDPGNDCGVPPDFDPRSGNAPNDHGAHSIGGGAADSITLADDRGLSIYADTNGDGTVDHVTTVLFDGRWETWSQEQVSESLPGDGQESANRTVNVCEGSEFDGANTPNWATCEWEREESGRWV
ncbi:DUF6802 family protein [Corynebacterium sp. H78]|uniref:DUF6802 family protein n=1 Tax=Corynebacterium sp. H78 TaxID=3133417 RepID=UPI0030B00544